MAYSYKLIASYAATGTVANIEFTSIPATYTDLQILLSGRTNRSGAINDGLEIAFNNSTANFTSRLLSGNGVSASSSTSTNNIGIINGSSSTANTFNNTWIYISNYAGNTNKSVSTDSAFEYNGTDGRLQLTALLWSDTAAITSIKLTSSTASSFVQYSTAYLYGISKS
jgi:hypothetical protein